MESIQRSVCDDCNAKPTGHEIVNDDGEMEYHIVCDCNKSLVICDPPFMPRVYESWREEEDE